MNVSQKSQYALRGIFELAKRQGRGPIAISKVAAAQSIPPRFLALILGELRRGGFVESRRGPRGGYLLAAPPELLSVGKIVRFIDGPIAPVRCVAGEGGSDCPLHGRCAFMDLWERARDAVAGVYDSTTFQDLVDQEPPAAQEYVPHYCI